MGSKHEHEHRLQTQQEQQELLPQNHPSNPGHVYDTSIPPYPYHLSYEYVHAPALPHLQYSNQWPVPIPAQAQFHRFPVLAYEPSHQQYSYAGFWPAQTPNHSSAASNGLLQQGGLGRVVEPSPAPQAPTLNTNSSASNAEIRAQPRKVFVNGQVMFPHGGNKTRTVFKPTKVALVTNLPETNDRELRTYFEVYCPIKTLNYIQRTQSCYVQFFSDEEADRFILVFDSATFKERKLACRMRQISHTQFAPQPTLSDMNMMRHQDRFFIVKSLTAEDVESSVANGLWATQLKNEAVLNRAFHVRGRLCF
jgi:hypothetical protein